MKKNSIYCIVLFAALLLPQVFAVSDVLVLTSANFKKVVLDSNNPVFVKFYAPWCGHCKSLAPAWEQTATNLKGIVSVGKVDCTQEQTLCSQFGVKGYPTLKLFKNKGTPIDYNQAREAPAMVRFATSQLEAKLVTVIKSVESCESFVNNHPETAKLILFTEKTTPSPLLKSLSVDFEGRINIGFVASTVKDVVEKYEVTTFPTLIHIKEGGEAIKFQDTISITSVRQFVSEIVGDAEPKPQATPPKPKAEPVSWVKVSAEDFESQCGPLCAIGYFGESQEVPEADQATLSTILDKFKKDKKFKFIIADSTTAAKFKLTTPAFAVYRKKGNKYAAVSEVNVATATSLLDRVLSGDVNYSSAA